MFFEKQRQDPLLSSHVDRENLEASAEEEEEQGW